MAEFARENITIFTDASYCHRTGAAGGGYWARFRETKLTGPISMPVLKNPTHAELLAAVWAVEKVLGDPALQNLNYGDIRVVLVTDCMNVKQMFENPKNRAYAPGAYEAISAILKRLQDVGALIKVNHVKAHNNDGTPRTWVNNHCDKLAGRVMRGMQKVLLRQGV